MDETVALIGLVEPDDAPPALARGDASFRAQTVPVKRYLLTGEIDTIAPQTTVVTDRSVLKTANELLTTISQEFVLFCPPTVELVPDAVEQLVNALEGSTAVAAYCQDGFKSKWGFVLEAVPRGYPNALATKYMNMFGPVLLVRRSALVSLPTWPNPLGVDSYKDGLHDLVLALIIAYGEEGFFFVNSQLANFYQNILEETPRSRDSYYLSPFDVPVARRSMPKGSVAVEMGDLPRTDIATFDAGPTLTVVVYGQDEAFQPYLQLTGTSSKQPIFPGSQLILAGPHAGKAEVPRISGSQPTQRIALPVFDALLQAQAAAEGDYILFLDSRACLTSAGSVHRLVKLMAASEASIVGARVVGLRPTNSVLLSSGWELKADGTVECLGAERDWNYQGPRSFLAVPHHCTAVNQGAVLVQRNKAPAVDPQAGESWVVDLCLRARASGLKVAYHPEVMVTWTEAVYPQPDLSGLGTSGVQPHGYYPAEMLFSGQDRRL